MRCNALSLPRDDDHVAPLAGTLFTPMAASIDVTTERTAMRFLTSLLWLITLVCLPIVSFARDLFATAGRGLAGHLHLVPAAPRSIVDTRRLGLA